MGFVFGEVDVTNLPPQDPAQYFSHTVNRTHNTAVELRPAPGSGRFIVIECLWWTNVDTETDTKVECYRSLADAGSSSNALLRGGGLALGGAVINGRIVLPENTPLVVRCTTASNIDVDINASGYSINVGV